MFPNPQGIQLPPSLEVNLHHQYFLIIILGSVASVLLVGIIGVLDDLRGWKKGLKQWQKPLLTLPAAIPFLLVNLNRTAIDLPFIGLVDLGLLFPLLFIPVAIVGASNAFNMPAGYNGLEAGMGIVILGTLGVLAHLHGKDFGVVFCLVGFSALVAFMIFNWYPSKVFPGDTMTYPIGSYIAICAILGSVEKFALLLFIPYYLDFLLPLRKRMKVEAFAKVATDGSFDVPYASVYDSTHLVIHLLKKFKKKVYEKNVVLTILGFELLLALLCVILFFEAK